MSNNNIKSKRLKIIGGTLLLLSFIVQNFIYDFWNEKADKYDSASKDFSDMSRSSLLYMNLYFSAQDGDTSIKDQIKSQYIHAAAIKEAQGLAIDIIASDTSKEAKINLCNALLQKAKTVVDYESFTDFDGLTNKIWPYNFLQAVNKTNQINSYRAVSRWIFLSIYLLGSLFLLIGIKYE